MLNAQEHPVPDCLLLDEHRKGNPMALEELLRRHKKTIYNLAYKMLQNEADAADVTQHVLLKASTHVDRFRGASTFKTWLFRIGLNLSRNAIRDRRRWQHEDLEALQLPGSEDPFQTTARREARERLKVAIRTLPSKQMQTVILRVYHEQSFSEIAATLGCREGTAKANYHHGVKALRRILLGRSHTNIQKDGLSLTALEQRLREKQRARTRAASNPALRAA